MPCLNEAAFIRQTAASLGFSATSTPPPNCHLVVVDNGSTDGTPDLLDQIRREATAPVHLFVEKERGYVPPRRAGVDAAVALSRAMGFEATSVLVLQVDADTIYKRGYVEAMQSAAYGQNDIMLEGATRRPPEFEAAHPSYIAAERLVDHEVEPFDLADEDEVVVDDKICGFRLADYLKWGGLFEEHTAAGDPIHAETTRMFIRAKLLHGARKVRVNPSGAASSRRKVVENPWLHFATVGFPREATWVRKWTTKISVDGNDVDAFANGVLNGCQRDAVYLRRAHQLALFRYLPALVMVASLGQIPSEFSDDIAAVLDAISTHSSEEIARAPGRALMDLLALIDSRPQLFGEL